MLSAGVAFPLAERRRLLLSSGDLQERTSCRFLGGNGPEERARLSKFWTPQSGADALESEPEMKFRREF
jgi:hypothetical protein